LGIELDDLVQEVVGYVYRSLDSYEKQPDASFNSWLLRIAENKIKDLWRRSRAQKRDGAVLFRDYLNSQISDPGFAASDPRASQVARANEIQALQDEAMRQLSERHRTVIEMRIEGLSYDEVAARMGYEKAGTVRALHNRAMERLRTLMDKVRESRGL
jgi:RNA polymerase sigma factor (sigma-70 family)